MVRVRRGFTLIELMVVLGIIAVVAAMAIPNLFEARKAANEVAAIGTLKSIASAQSVFREADKDQNGIIDYGDLAALSAAKLIDPILGTGTKAGYWFEADGVSAPGKIGMLYWSLANPRMLDGTGNYAYCSNHQGSIFYTRDTLFSVGDLIDLKADAVIPPFAKPVK